MIKRKIKKLNKKNGFTRTLTFKKRKLVCGFTIIETMISVALFLIIIMAGMGALLNASFIHGKSQATRSIMDNLSFIMEDMSRNIRVGYNYHCIENGGDVTATNPHSCSNGGGISFKSADGNSQLVYAIYPNSIKKSVDGGHNFIQLNPVEVIIDPSSSFEIIGAESSSQGDNQQPFVIIRLVGKIHSIKDNTDTPFSLQTSVSQRLIDVTPPTPPIPPNPPASNPTSSD